MKQIDNLQHGGVKTDGVWLHAVRDIINQRDAVIASLVFDKTILKGVVETGNTVTDGIVIYKGKPYTFKGGAKQPKVTIKKVQTLRPNANQDAAPFTFESTMSFGEDGIESFNYADLQRYYPSKNMPKEIRIVGGSVTNADLVGTGFFVADGTNGTDNLTDVYFKVANNTSSVGTKSGSNERTLTAGNIPEHDHDTVFQRANNDWDSDSSNIGLQRKGDPARHQRTDVTIKTDKWGASNPAPINIEPKRYIVKAIQFVG